MKLSDNVKLAGVIAIVTIVLVYTYIYVTPESSNTGFLELFTVLQQRQQQVHLSTKLKHL